MTANAGHGVITADWADGTYTFRLEWKHWYELQDKLKCGPNELADRLIGRKWRVQDVSEVVRLGLIGGGTAPVAALKLVDRYVHQRPLLENVGIAAEIVWASLIGPQKETGNPEGEPTVATENAVTSELISDSSMATVQ